MGDVRQSIPVTPSSLARRSRPLLLAHLSMSTATGRTFGQNSERRTADHSITIRIERSLSRGDNPQEFEPRKESRNNEGRYGEAVGLVAGSVHMIYSRRSASDRTH